MKRLLSHALCGVAIAVGIRLLHPGEHPHGYLFPVVFGAFGGWAGDWVGRRAGLYRGESGARFVMAALGAMTLMLMYGVFGP